MSDVMLKMPCDPTSGYGFYHYILRNKIPLDRQEDRLDHEYKVLKRHGKETSSVWYDENDDNHKFLLRSGKYNLAKPT